MVRYLSAARRQAARRQPDGSYKAISSGQVARFHPSGALHGRQPAPECVIYTELVQTTKMFIRGVSAIEPQWCGSAHGGGVSLMRRRCVAS